MLQQLAQQPATVLRVLADSFSDGLSMPVPAGAGTPTEYPLVLQGPYYKKLRHNLTEFLHCFVRQCQHGLLYEQHLMETLLNFLITMTDSPVRAFRHTGTFSGIPRAGNYPSPLLPSL